MMNETLIIIDDELVLDVNSGIVGSKNNSLNKNKIFEIDDLISEIDDLEVAIDNLETSLDPRTTSYLSELNREGVYRKAGLLTNIVIGIIIAMVVIILLI